MNSRPTASALGNPAAILALAAFVPLSAAPTTAQPPAAVAQTAPAAVPARAAPAAEQPAALSRPTDLISTQRGTLGIIISAPHGGSVRVPGSTGREGGVQVRDVNTAEIALLVAQRLTDKLGAKPSFVIAQFSRKDADANRDRAAAADNDASRAQYDAYHGALRMLVDEARAATAMKPKTGGGKAMPRAILVDIHGQARVPEAIVRGTRNGQTVSALLARSGSAALTGPSSIFGFLKEHGYTVIPDPENPKANVEPNADGAAAEGGSGVVPGAGAGLPTTKPGESGASGEAAGPVVPGVADTRGHSAAHGRETFFDGGYIVAHYGSQNQDGIDAIQIEIGAQRSSNTLKVSRDIADAIAAFYEQFLREP